MTTEYLRARLRAPYTLADRAPLASLAAVLLAAAVTLLAAAPTALAQSSSGSSSGSGSADSSDGSDSSDSSLAGRSGNSLRELTPPRAVPRAPSSTPPATCAAASSSPSAAGCPAPRPARPRSSRCSRCAAAPGRPSARATTRSGGRFSASWRPPGPGRFRVRARPLGEALASGARLVDTEEVNVYRPGLASWYGPGLYGNRTACGQTIRPSTLGVAHKRLPCGTARDVPLRQPHGHRPGDRPRPVRGQPRVGPDRGDPPPARLPLDRHGLVHAVGASMSGSDSPPMSGDGSGPGPNRDSPVTLVRRRAHERVRLWSSVQLPTLCGGTSPLWPL